jgi:hypothetical protein
MRWLDLAAPAALLALAASSLPGPLYPAPDDDAVEGKEILDNDRVWIPIDLTGVRDLQLFLDRHRLGEGEKLFRSGCDETDHGPDEALSLTPPVWLAIGDPPERPQCATGPGAD